MIGFLAGAGLQVSGIEAFSMALAIWGAAALWALLALITWPPVARWLPAIAITWPAFQREPAHAQMTGQPVSASKGFIDFWVDAEKAGKDFPTLLRPLGKRTRDIGEKLSRQGKRLANATGDAQKTHKVASDTAKDIDGYSAFIESILPELRATQKLFTEGWLGYLETSPEARDKSKKSDLEAFRSTVQDLRKTVRTSRENVAGFRNATLGIRQRNASQRLNSATDRLADELARVVSEMRDLESALQRVIRVLTARLDEIG